MFSFFPPQILIIHKNYYINTFLPKDKEHKLKISVLVEGV